jgi:TonB family protein
MRKCISRKGFGRDDSAGRFRRKYTPEREENKRRRSERKSDLFTGSGLSGGSQSVKASGAVNVQVTIDEQGNVVSASAVSGHPLLRQAAEEAARNAKFAPTSLQGVPVTVTGVIVYNFVP